MHTGIWLRVDSGVTAEGSSELLLARARRGDFAALEQLYRAYEGPVYNLARRICATPEDAEEVLQESFLEVIRSIGRFRGDGSIWSWIRKIAATKALMRLRSDRVRHAEALEDLAVEPGAHESPRE